MLLADIGASISCLISISRLCFAPLSSIQRANLHIPEVLYKSSQQQARFLSHHSCAIENSTRRIIRSGQPARKWTAHEDVAIVEALTEICVTGYWKVENGLRSGYLAKLEEIIERKLSNYELKVDPHIEFQLKTLKKQTLAIFDMISNSSGFSWNHEEKMMVCEKQVFDDSVKVHKDAKGLRMTQFIHYDSLIEAFGKDRANGLAAKGPGEADEVLNNDSNYVDIGGDGLDEYTTPSPVTHTSAYAFAPTTHPPSTHPPSARTRKRGRDVYSQCLGDMAGTLLSFMDVTKTHLETMQGVLMAENVTSERKGNLVSELMKIEGINDYDVIEAATAIIDDNSKIELLFSLPNNLKRQWIHKLLGH